MTFNLEEFLTAAKQRADEAAYLKKRREYYNAYLKSETWKKIRQQKLNRSRRCCEVCGATKDLHVHHLIYDRFGGAERMTDLQVLCKPCHNKAHGRKF